jgi:hypothetical protein
VPVASVPVASVPVAPASVPVASELLAAWEMGQSTGDARRALLLHALARPSADPDQLLAVPVGERDIELFAMRKALFGARMEVRLSCAGCGEEIEFALDTDEIAATRPEAGPARRDPDPIRVQKGDWEVSFRLPTPGDLAAAGAAGGSTGTALAARRMLLSRCVVEATRAGRPAAADELPEHVQREVAAAAERADPGADVRLDAPCPDCGHHTRAELDIVSFLWSELDTWVRGVLLDVHLLASSYGWTEPEVLALTPLRRRYYLELAGHA